VPVVAFAAHDVVARRVRRLGRVWAELVREAVGRVLLVARVVGIDAQRTVEV